MYAPRVYFFQLPTPVVLLDAIVFLNGWLHTWFSATQKQFDEMRPSPGTP